MRLALLGPPGAGKGTQARFLCDRYRIAHVATGDLLRQAQGAASDLGRQVAPYLAAGELVPDELIIQLVRERLAEPDCQPGYLLDGVPRTVPQAEGLRRERIRLDYLLEIAVPDQEIVERLSGRWYHPGSGRTYHLLYNPPRVPGRDDLTGEPLVQREDDREEVVRRRLALYHAQTEPVLAWYQRWQASGDPEAPRRLRVNGSGSVEEVRQRILQALEQQERA